MSKKIKEVNIFLAKREISNPSQFIASTVKGVIEKKEYTDPSGVLLLMKGENPPWWQKAFELPKSKFGFDKKVTNISHSALFVTERNGRVIAVTFGPGSRFNIERSGVDKNFGLYTALNSIDPESMKAFDSVHTKGIGRFIRTRRSANFFTNLENLGFNLLADAISKVSGKPEDDHSSLCGLIEGGISLKLRRGKFDLNNIGQLIDQVLKIYDSDNFRYKFPFLEGVLPIKDDGIISKLNDVFYRKLHDAISKGDSSNFSIGVCDLKDEEEIEEFQCEVTGGSGNPEKMSYLEIQTLFKFCKDRNLNKIDLGNILIKGFGANNVHISTSPLFDILTTEVDHENSTYFCIQGIWHKLTAELVARVNSSVDSLPNNSSLNFIPFNRHTGSITKHRKDIELFYNHQFSHVNKGECLDQKPVMIGGSQVEACDILLGQTHFVHIKRGTLSRNIHHLIRQGLNSAHYFLRHEKFRQQLSTLSPTIYNGFKPSQKPDASSVKVDLGIITPKSGKWSEILPFNAKMTIHVLQEELRSLGVSFSLNRIGETDVDPKNDLSIQNAKQALTAAVPISQTAQW